MQYRLKEARIEAGYTQEQVAELINSAQYQIHKYESGKQEISLARAIDLADIYHCTLDYLAGRSNVNNWQLANEEKSFVPKII